MSHARAALAGALVMLLGIWIMTIDQSAWQTKDVVFAVIALLAVAMLLVGIDIRGRGHNVTYHEDYDHGHEDHHKESNDGKENE